MAERHGVDDIRPDRHDRRRAPRSDRGRGTDAVVDAVGLEAHGNAGVKFAQQAVGLLPDAVPEAVMDKAGMDRLAAVYASIDVVRRGGTVSLSGVYAGEADILPMKTLFDKQITLRMGQCNVKRWIDDLLPLVEDPADPLGVMDLVTHHAPLEDAPGSTRPSRRRRTAASRLSFAPSSGARRQPRRARRGWREVAAITHAEVFGKGPSRGVLPA